MKRRKNTIFSSEKSLVNSQKHNGLVHLDIVDYLTAGFFYIVVYMHFLANRYINICMHVIYMGSIPGIVKDVFYRANEGTKIHLIYSEISLK